MQARRDGERRIHTDYTGIEIEFGHALETAGWTLFDTDAATFAESIRILYMPFERSGRAMQGSGQTR